MKPTEFLQTEEFRRMREIQLDLLRRFIRLCEEYDIPYFAIYGTLLGAYRHRGYIPWDDDVDIALWRGDYDRLRQAAAALEPPYRMIFPEDESKEYWGSLIALENTDTTEVNLNKFYVGDGYGVRIDLTPIDYTFSNALLRGCKNRLVDLAHETVFMQKYGEGHDCVAWMPGYRKRIVKALARMLDRKRLLRLVKRLETLHGFRRSACTFCSYRLHDVVRAEYFSETVQLPFEDLSIAAPAQYLACLEDLYGDQYRELPPKEQQIPHHAIDRFLDPCTPYRETLARLRSSMYAPEGKVFLIWGAGNMFEHFVRHFGHINMPDSLIDNDPAKWGTTRHGCPVCSPELLKQYRPEEVHLVICNIYVREISGQIRSMGGYEYSIYWENWVDAEFGASDTPDRPA